MSSCTWSLSFFFSFSPFCLLWRCLSFRSRQWAGVTIERMAASLYIQREGQRGWAGKTAGKPSRQDKRKSTWASCSVSVSLILCFLTVFSFIIPAALAVSAKSDSSAWIQFSADAAFSQMERLKRRFPMLEPAFLADVLTTRQEGESRPYRRIEIEMQGYVCVCPCCQSEVDTFRIIRGHRWPKNPACWGQPTWKCCRGHFPKISHRPSESQLGVLYTSSLYTGQITS